MTNAIYRGWYVDVSSFIETAVDYSRAFKLDIIDDCCVDHILQHYDVGSECREMWGMGRWVTSISEQSSR